VAVKSPFVTVVATFAGDDRLRFASIGPSSRLDAASFAFQLHFCDVVERHTHLAEPRGDCVARTTTDQWVVAKAATGCP